MSAHISAHGRLARDPQARTTKTAKTMVLASIAVDATPNNSEQQETLWLSLMAFGSAAEALGRCKQGESVSVMGRLTKGRYVTQSGETRESWTCLVDAVITARTARPGGGRKRGDQDQGRQDQGHRPHRPEFDDELSF